MSDLIEIPDIELMLSEQSGDELDFQAVKEIGSAHFFRLALQELHEDFNVLWARPGAKALEGGYWYIYKLNRGKFRPQFWQVNNGPPGYEPCEPDQRHLDMMIQLDASRSTHGGYGAINERRMRQQRERENTARARHAEFREKLLERLNHIYDTRIAITPAMKARFDGEAVTEGGVVLPDAVTRLMERSQETGTAPAGEAPPTPPSEMLGAASVTSPACGATLSESKDGVNANSTMVGAA